MDAALLQQSQPNRPLIIPQREETLPIRQRAEAQHVAMLPVAYGARVWLDVIPGVSAVSHKKKLVK